MTTMNNGQGPKRVINSNTSEKWQRKNPTKKKKKYSLNGNSILAFRIKCWFSHSIADYIFNISFSHTFSLNKKEVMKMTWSLGMSVVWGGVTWNESFSLSLNHQQLWCVMAINNTCPQIVWQYNAIHSNHSVNSKLCKYNLHQMNI